MTILSLASFLTWLLIHITHAWNLAWAWGWVFNILLPYYSTFRSSLWCFFLYVEHQVEPPHLLTFGVIYCICGKPLNPTRIHFFVAPMVGGWTTSNDKVQNVFVSIARDMGFHVSCDQTHVLSPPFFQSSREQVDILLSIDGICTLAYVVIVNPHSSRFGFSNYFIGQGGCKNGDSSKERILLRSTHAINMFFPLAIEVFECIHQQAYDFLHICASMAWLPKGTNGLPLIILRVFYRWKMSIAL